MTRIAGDEAARCDGRLACVGDLMLDVLIESRTLRDGMEGGIYIRSGGSAANVAVWAQRMGFPSAWVGTVGVHPTGELLLRELRESSVVPIHRVVDVAEPGVVISRIGRGAKRVMQSARWAATRELSASQLDALRRAAAVHVTGYTAAGPQGLAPLRQVLETSGERGGLLSFDPSDRGIIDLIGPAALTDLLAGAGLTVIFANDREASCLTGMTEPESAARALAEIAEVAVVKQGGRGCLLATSHGVLRIPAVRVKPVDTTGAGDGFAGAWLATHLMGSDPASAAHAGAAAAAEVVRSIGARPTHVTRPGDRM